MWTSQRDFLSLSLPSLMLTINNQRFCYSKSLTGCKIQTDVWWQESTCENNITVAGPKISEFCVKTTWRIKSQNQDNHPMYTAQKIGPNNWPKEMRIMSATHVDTCTNALKNTRDLPSVNTSEKRGKEPRDISFRFKILQKCQSKLDSFIYEMLFIKELKCQPWTPGLTQSVQSYFYSAKYFIYSFCKSFCPIVI